MTPDEQTVERYSVEPWDIRRADMKRDPEGQYVRYDDHCAAIAATKEAGMDRLAAEGQQCDAIAKARNDALREAADTAASCAAHFERMRARSEPFLNSIDREHRHDAAMKGKGAEFAADHIRKMIKEPTT